LDRGLAGPCGRQRKRRAIPAKPLPLFDKSWKSKLGAGAIEAQASQACDSRFPPRRDGAWKKPVVTRRGIPCDDRVAAPIASGSAATC
jgi:hypothetical protein